MSTVSTGICFFAMGTVEAICQVPWPQRITTSGYDVDGGSEQGFSPKRCDVRAPKSGRQSVNFQETLGLAQSFSAAKAKPWGSHLGRASCSQTALSLRSHPHCRSSDSASPGLALSAPKHSLGALRGCSQSPRPQPRGPGVSGPQADAPRLDRHTALLAGQPTGAWSLIERRLGRGLGRLALGWLTR